MSQSSSHLRKLRKDALLAIESATRAGSYRVGSTRGGVEEIVEIDVYVTDLEAHDGSKWSTVGGKASVAFEDIIAIRYRSVGCSSTRRWNLGRTRIWIAPRALWGSSAIAASAAEFAFHKGSNRPLHGFVIRRAKRPEQHLVVALESQRIWNHRIFNKKPRDRRQELTDPSISAGR